MPNIRSHVQAVSVPFLGLLLHLFTSHAVFGQESMDGHFGLTPFPGYRASETIYKPLAPTPFEIQTLCQYPSIANHNDLPSITFPRGKSANELWEQKEWERKHEEKRHLSAMQAAWEKKEKLLAEQQLALNTYEQERRDEAQHKLAMLNPKIPSLIEQTAAFNEYSNQQWPYAIDRLDYLKKYTHNPDHWEHKKYHLSHESTDLLKNHKIDVKEYEQLYGNHLQHGIHSEHVALISHATKLHSKANKASDTLQVCSFVVLAINTSHGTNIQDDFIRSLEINDVCFHILNPTHYAYLAGQLAKIQSHIEIDESTNWQKAFDCLYEASQHDEGLSACLKATEKYATQFKKAKPDYAFHVLKIMSEMSVNAFPDLSLKQQFELLETHHEAIAIKALRSLHEKTDTNTTLEYAIQVLDLDNAQLLHNQNLITTVLDPIDSLERTRTITNTPYHSTTQMPFVTAQGILKEHALIVDAHNLTLPPKHAPQQLKLISPTHDMLHIYCTADTSEDQEWAANGLFHALQATNCHNQKLAEVHASIVQQYHGVLVHQQNNELLIWDNDLAREYKDANQQKVHEELVWLTHSYLSTQYQRFTNESEIAQRLLDEIEDKLLLAHSHNQQNQPEESHTLIENITGIFGAVDNAGQRAPYVYQSLNLNASVEHISNSIDHTIKHIKQVNKTNCDINEKIKYATNELSKLSIQSGRLKRDLSLLNEEEAHDFFERKSLCHSRGSKQQTIKKKINTQAGDDFDRKFPLAKQVLSQKEYVEIKQQHAKAYSLVCFQNARKQQAGSLDHITTHLDSHIPFVKASEIVGFNIKPTTNTLDITCAPEHILQSCKEFWPPEELVEEIFELWTEELALYTIGAQEAAYKRYSDRYDAYQETKDNPYIFIERTYEISPDAQALLDKNEINTTHLRAGTYNPLQHQLHTELLDILEQTTALDTQDSVGDLLIPTNRVILDFISTAAHTNQTGDIICTGNMIDFCWAALDCGQAFLEGVLEGGIDVAKYAYEHPIETILFTVASKYMFYYQITKLVYDLGNLALDYFLSEEPTEPKAAIRFRDIVKGATSFATQMYINHKLNPVLTNYVDSAKSKLIDRLIHEEHWLLPQSLKNKLFDTATEKAQVVLANGEKINVVMKQDNFNSNLEKQKSSKLSRSSSNSSPGHNQKNPNSTLNNNSSKELLLDPRTQRKLQENRERLAQVEEALKKRPQKDAWIQQQNTNTSRNIKCAQTCIQHVFEEHEKYLLKKMDPFKELLFKKYGLEIKGANIAHWMELDWNTIDKRFTGFHSTNLHPENVIYYTHGPNKHSISKAIVGKFGKSKPSSLYPRKWDANIISDKVVEALLTGVKETAADGTITILGQAQNYVPGKGILPFNIEIILTPKGIIDTTYPIY